VGAQDRLVLSDEDGGGRFRANGPNAIHESTTQTSSVSFQKPACQRGRRSGQTHGASPALPRRLLAERASRRLERCVGKRTPRRLA
jgi:hypothetical protein